MKIDEQTKMAVEIEIDHIEELYGKDALIYAQKVLKKVLKRILDREIEER